MIMWVVPFICGFSSSSVWPQGDLCSTVCWQTDLFPAPSTSAPVASGDSVALSTVASGALNSLRNQITVTVAHMLQRSLPTFVTAFCAENLVTPVSSAAPVSNIVSSSAMVAASSLSSNSGTLLPGSVNYSFDYGITCFQWFFGQQKILCHATRHLWSARVMHPFRQNWWHKITSSEFVELVDLSTINLCAVDLEYQYWLVEVEDLLTWTEAFTIYQMVICAPHSHRCSDLNK